ncbi:MAG: hypothetical protein ACK5TO_21330, partial [Planctomycetaceae bacterium]
VCQTAALPSMWNTRCDDDETLDMRAVTHFARERVRSAAAGRPLLGADDLRLPQHTLGCDTIL